MRTLSLFTVLLALLGCAEIPSDASPAVTLSRLRGPIYVAEDTFYAKENSLVYVGDRGVSVIGASWTPQTAELLHREIRKITSLPVVDVILTNHHPDRAGGAEYWISMGAAVLSTAHTGQLLQQNWSALVADTRSAFASYPELSTPRPTRTYAGDFTTQGGLIRSIYVGPSHTEDGIFVYFPLQKVLFGGCILKEHLGNLAYANVVEYPQTLKRLQQLDLPIEIIVAGHWSPVHGPELLPAYLKLLQEHARGSSK
jgi:metallo-beta-lactamase class B